MNIDEKVNNEAKKQGYACAKNTGKKYNGMDVYIPYGAMEIGFPVLFLADEKGNVYQDYNLWKTFELDDFEPTFTKEETTRLMMSYL